MSGGEGGGGRGYQPETRARAPKPASKTGGLFGAIGLGEPTGPVPDRTARDLGSSGNAAGAGRTTSLADAWGKPKKAKQYVGGPAAPEMTEEESRAAGRVSTILTSGLGDMGEVPGGSKKNLLGV